MRGPILWLVALALLGCGTPAPATMAEQLVVLEAASHDAEGWARLGWWRLLTADTEGAAVAFERGGRVPLAALGRARLAKDALDVRRTLAEAAMAAQATGRIGTIGRAWAIDAARWLPDGERLLKGALGEALARRVALAHPQYTVRISFLPHLELPALQRTPPTLDGAFVEALNKRWALQTEAPKPDPDGLALTTWPLVDGVAHLELKVAGLVSVWRDGRLVLASDPTRFTPEVVRFSAPGAGPLVVAWAASATPKIWRLDAAAADLDVGEGPKVEDRGAAPDRLAQALSAEQAILDGDGDQAAAYLRGAPETPAFDMLRARAAPLDRGQPARVARDEAKAGWTAALAQAPGRARLALGRLAWREGRQRQAVAHLRAALATRPDAFEAHHVLLQVLVGAGVEPEARAGVLKALAAAERVAPGPCALRTVRAALGAETAAEQDTLLALDERCGHIADAARTLLEQHRPDAALALIDRQPKGRREATVLRRLRARALLGLGQLDKARAAFASLPSAEDRMMTVDLSTSSESLKVVVARFPTRPAALSLGAAVPGWSPFASLMLDTEAVIAAFEGSVAADGPLLGPAARVLDHSATLFYADGKALRWVHEVLAIQSREAAETFGELGLPDGVHVVALYNRKADGRRLFAEDTPGKDAISVPDVTKGDYIVAQYVEASDNGYLYDRGYLTPRAYFQGVDLPIFRQRLEVFSPDDLPPEVQRLNGAPAPESVRLGARAGLRFEARRVPLWAAEADAPPAGLWLPSVRLGHGVQLSEDLGFLRDRALARRRRSVGFDTWAVETAGEGAPATRAQRLAAAVRATVRDEAGLIEVDAGDALHRGTGNRALVLSAAMEAAGLPHTLWIVRPRLHVPSGPFLQVADFPYPLIQTPDGWFDPGPDRAPPGFVAYPFLGGEGLQVWPPEGPARPTVLPTERAVADTRTIEVDAVWADGVVRGEVTDRLVGQEAIVIGGYFARLDVAQHPRLVERLLVGAFGAGTVTHLEPLASQDPNGTLTLRYTFEAKVPGDQLALGMFPASPGRNWASLPARTIPLSVDLPVDQRVRIRLRADRDISVQPKVGRHEHGGHLFELKAALDDDELLVETHLRLVGGTVAPADYPAFAKWARAVDASERMVVRFR